MRRSILRCLIALGIACAWPILAVPAGSPAAGRVSGHWEGAFSRFGATQAVQIDIAASDSGLSGTYDIPDLILHREPLKEVSCTGDTLVFRLFWGQFRCILYDQIAEITGENLKWNPPVFIHLKRAAKPERYRIEPVRFAGDSVELAGDLLIPAGNPPFPAVVLIEGSTAEGRKLWTYRSLADLFAQNGIAALVYDKRGVGASKGTLDNATLDQLASDAAGAVRFLQGRAEVNPRSIGLLGISQGGWLAPLAARQCPDLAFLILYSGPAVSVWDQELERVEYSMRAGSLNEDKPDSFSSGEISEALKHTRLGFDVAQHPERFGEWQKSVKHAYESRWWRYVGLDSTIEDLQGWLRQRYDPTETLKQTRVPLLALCGENDVLVPPALNAPKLRSLLAEAKNSDVTIVTFPGVGHDLIRNATLIGDDWHWPTGFWLWTRRAPGLADSLVVWTKRHTGR